MKDNTSPQNQEDIYPSQETSLDLSYKSITDGPKIFKEILTHYPNIQQLDLSNNKITLLPENLEDFKELEVLDLRMNPLENVTYFHIIFVIVKPSH